MLKETASKKEDDENMRRLLEVRDGPFTRLSPFELRPGLSEFPPLQRFCNPVPL